MEVGVTEMPLSVGGGGPIVRGNVSLTPAYDAVKVTSVEVVTVPALAENVAELDPWGMVTVGGTIAPAGEAARDIRAPPLSAGAVSATVQMADAGGTSDIGLQENPFNAGWMIPTLVPVVDIVMDAPAASAAAPFDM